MVDFDRSVYALEREMEVPEANANGTLLRHIKSGARLFLLENDDENKVFSIAFRTPPADDTGVAHILEHSVLCGSEKYPVKDPFVELAKGSLNTFLNAITYPDKTIYPVASCNDTDFRNLMSVYMDAVLHPNIYRNENIFRQEGWHYDLTSPEDELTVNGVVYSEMKGAFSSPNEVLNRYIKSALFPNTAYAFESGGDPEAIPSLTYEQFLDFHRTYYHPSNSYIYLYGNIDMAERLKWLDTEYLCHYDAAEVKSELQIQPPFEKEHYLERYYGITEEEPEGKKTFLTMVKAVGDALDMRTVEAFQVLEYALLTAPGAPLRRALLSAGIGEDVLGGVDTLRQISFEITVRGADKDQLPQFQEIVKKTLKELTENGIDRKTLLAGININEFKAREADFGSTPTGLVYGLQSLDTWLYDDGKPETGIRYEEVFAFLRENVDTGYFEDLIRRSLLENPHGIVMTLEPKKGYTERQEAELAQKLAAKKAAMTPDEMQELIRQTRELREYQESEDAKEDLEKIPLLSLEDIGTEPAPIQAEQKNLGKVPVLHHEMFTGGIEYLRLMFDCSKVEQEDLPYLSLLRSVLGYVDTEHYSYRELSDEINIHTGGIDMGTGIWCRKDDTEHPHVCFTIVASSLYEKVADIFRLLEEIVFHSDFSDNGRLAEILGERRSRAQVRLTQSGHSVAVLRCQSYFSRGAWISEQLGGLDFYHFLGKAEKRLKQEPGYLAAKLTEVASKVFRLENLLVSCTANAEGYGNLYGPLTHFAERLPEGSSPDAPRRYELSVKNEGLKFSSQINYVAQCGSYKEAGYMYTGAMRVLQTILGYDYLWQNLRVKGGAYGCMSGLSREGDGYFVSYRDPNLCETLQIYEQIPEYLERFDVGQRDMEKYIIGTISEMDTPLNPAAKGRRSLQLYLAGITQEDLRKERMEVLQASKEDIRRLCGPVRAVLGTGAVCVVGNAEQISRNSECFGSVGSLL